MAFCHELDSAVVQSLYLVASFDTYKVFKVPWLSHFPSVEGYVEVLFLLIMSATHAEKKLGIRERELKWNRRSHP